MAKYNKNQQQDISLYFKTYKVLKTKRIKNIIFYLITLILFTILFIFTLQQNIDNNFDNDWFNFLLIFGYFFLFGFIIYESWNLKYKEITINKEGIRYKSLLKNTFIEKTKIDGYKFYKNEYTGHTLTIKDVNNIKISIHAEDFKYEDILIYLNQITYNINETYKQEIEKDSLREKQELINELSTFQISKNKEKTKHIISQKLNKIHNKTLVINLIFSVFSIYLLIYGEPYQIFMNLSYLSILFLFAFIFYHKGFVQLNNWFESELPSLLLSFLMLAVSHTLRFSLDYNIIEIELIFYYALIVPTIFFVLFYFIKPLKKYVTKRIFFMNLLTHFIILYLMNLSALNFYNCYYDNSKGIKYKVKVIEKYEHTRRKGPTTFQITINKKIEGEFYEDVDISSNTFYNTKVGDSVNLVMNEGLLGFKWYYVEK